MKGIYWSPVDFLLKGTAMPSFDISLKIASTNCLTNTEVKWLAIWNAMTFIWHHCNANWWYVIVGLCNALHLKFFRRGPIDDVIIIHHKEVVGGYIGFTPSVCPSAYPSRLASCCGFVHTKRRLSCILCPLCSTYSSGWIHFIFIHLIKQLQKMCRV